MSSQRIALTNRQRRTQLDVPALKRFAADALSLCLASASPGCSVLRTLREIDVLFISDARMAQIHRRFLNLAGPTDVITFEHGEIFISVDTAIRQAKRFGTTSEYELRLYLVHGLLHLHGFDDQSPA